MLAIGYPRPMPPRSLLLFCAALLIAACDKKTPPNPSNNPEPTPTPPLVPGPWHFGAPLPGLDGFAAPTVAALTAAYAQRNINEARTRHLRPDGQPKFSNRLLMETSPYLRQHAHNPVNWYPWGDEAFERAAREGKLVLLSVGYSTCHWCHVMEEESFEDLDVASYLNLHYVAIKVDREERPDIDAIYMAAVQASTGRGGWPMTVWLLPNGEPIYGATYFPRDRFLSTLQRVRDRYEASQESVRTSAARLAEVVRDQISPTSDASTRGAMAPKTLHDAVRVFLRRYDAEYGGMRGAPKFPSSLPVRFLLRYHRRAGSEEAKQAALFTLEHMAAGGIYDHVGGGFHRYSTDAKWRVPHFEKMLYDNALLVSAYTEGYQVAPNPRFAEVVHETLAFVERELMAPSGAFYAALDADSLAPDKERREGYFYTWTPRELAALLPRDQMRAVQRAYNITDAGNYEGRSVLFRSPKDTLPAPVQQALPLLHRARAKRARPLLDDKIISAWNGLMISAFVQSGAVFSRPTYVEKGARAAKFVLTQMRDPKGRLRRIHGGHKGAFLDDYAFLVAALLDLFEVTGDSYWLTQARALDQTVKAHYEDPKGGFFFTSDDHEALLARARITHDGARPSGLSVHTLNLLRLYQLTLQSEYIDRAEAAVGSVEQTLMHRVTSLSEMLLAVDFRLDRAKQIVIASPAPTPLEHPLRRALYGVFLPNAVLVPHGAPSLARLIPYVRGKRPRQNQATAYVCEYGRCERPTSDPSVLRKQLKKVEPL